MRPKNTTRSIPYKLTHRAILIFIIAISLHPILNGCSKEAIAAANQSTLENYFETNVLNSNFRVQLATDNGTDLTAQYDGFTFVLLKATLLNGPMTATKNGVTYNGTWSSNSDYSKLVITLPALPAEFAFLNREWKFTKKSLPIMELAPWGTLEPKVLHMEKY